jgi:site-specific recombinase XerD
MSEPITSDNYYLSRPKPVLVHASAVDRTCLPEAVASYVRDSLAEKTRRAYQSDLRHFEMWGGSLPASPETVAAYLAAYADRLSVTTLIRRLAALSKAHQAHGLSNPIRSELVRATLRGIKRRHTALQAKPLLRDDLLLVLDAMGNGLKDLRDRAVLLIGFAAALRSAETKMRS